MTQTDAVLKAILEKMIAAGGPYDPAALFVGVATAVVDLGVLTTQANVTEATGAMATRVACTPWGSPYKLADGRWVVDGPVCVFAPASAAEAQTLSHVFLNSAAAAGTLKAFKPITPVASMVDENSQFNIHIRLTVDKDGRWDQNVIFTS